MDFSEISRLARETVEAQQGTQREIVKEMAGRWGISEEFAEYILRLEYRVQKLEG